MSEVARPAGVVARQSHGKMTSVADQLRAGHEACEAQSWPVFRDYCDKVSASPFATKQRDEWPELLDDISGGRLGVVLMWDTARGDRTLERWAAFLRLCKQHDVWIYIIRDRRVYDMRIPRDWRTLAEDGVRAQDESENKSLDVRRGVAGAAMAGKGHGAPAWGYTRVYDQHDRKKFTQEPNDSAPVVAEIIERVARKDPIILIERDLNERKIPSPTGGPWRRNTIRNMTRNPAYAGLRRHKVTGPDGKPTGPGTLYTANWPAIVLEETWLRAQRVLDDPKRKTTQPGRFKWLLSYLGVAACGGGLNARARGSRRRVYGCVADGCVGVDQEALDEYVTRLAFARLAQPDVRRMFEPNTEEAAIARAQLAKAKEELAALGALMAKGPDAGGLSPELAAIAEPGIRARINAATAKLAATNDHGAVLDLLGEGEVTEERLRPLWDRASIAARRSVLTALFEEIKVGPSHARTPADATDEERILAVSERVKAQWRRWPADRQEDTPRGQDQVLA